MEIKQDIYRLDGKTKFAFIVTVIPDWGLDAFVQIDGARIASVEGVPEREQVA